MNAKKVNNRIEVKLDNGEPIFAFYIAPSATDCATAFLYGFYYTTSKIKYNKLEAFDLGLRTFIEHSKVTMIIFSDSTRKNAIYSLLKTFKLSGWKRKLMEHSVNYGEGKIRTLVLYK